ncbi:transcriptional regulator NanR [Rhodopila globiformis]|uniref:GntR family transcriptional regulator n=1 Tax=Rhodopila globiformis TaxID=1071 RepID=A0A2S6NKW1_RHOGL|nr:transcriptional regulator NanR [Rhodopila globiformis]PPQ35786.1 GntR family transcriptional regulator [Rhodopila globiformis]
MPENQKIVRRKLSDEVLARLLQAIESGEYPPGAQLPSERELMTTYGVGRPAVREALQALGNRGLVAISHGERARVLQPTAADVIQQIDGAARHLLTMSPQSLEHLKQAREFFEVGMAAEAARHAEPEDIARLEAALNAQKCLLQTDTAAFVAADMEFHTTIATVTRNPVFEAVSGAMLQWLSRFHSGLLHRKSRDVTLVEHRSILDAIAARDPERAASAMRSHLYRAGPLYSSPPQVLEKAL